MKVGNGTYSFDTVTQEWKKEGEELLPFIGRAEHDHGLGHWFGIMPFRPYHLCAMNSLYPPMVQHILEDFDPPEDWRMMCHYLVNLGSGRFCVAKGFEVYGDDETWETNSVLIGLEVKRCSDQPGGLKMTKHKTKHVANLLDIDTFVL
ncbi:hypothetical protein ACP70R_016781 [Stipagrostis hirtigluma subsp. patula]